MASTVLAKEFSEYLVNVVNVRVDFGPWQFPNSSVVNFTRRDTLDHVLKVTADLPGDHKPVQKEMAASSVYIDEVERKIIQGDLSVPFPIHENKVKQLEEVVCMVEKVHKHEVAAWGNLAHIHIVDCSLKGDLRIIKVANVLST